MLNFNDVAAKKVEEIERPPLPPVGTYRWQVTKLPVTDSFTGKDGREWDTVNFTVKLVEPMEDVDPDSLAEFKGDITNTISRVQFMFNKQDEGEFNKSLFRLKTFFGHLGIAEGTISESLNSSVGGQFLGSLNHRPDPQNPEISYAEITKTAPLD